MLGSARNKTAKHSHQSAIFSALQLDETSRSRKRFPTNNTPKPTGVFSNCAVVNLRDILASVTKCSSVTVNPRHLGACFSMSFVATINHFEPHPRQPLASQKRDPQHYQVIVGSAPRLKFQLPYRGGLRKCSSQSLSKRVQVALVCTAFPRK
jgi:hypothetical protein